MAVPVRVPAFYRALALQLPCRALTRIDDPEQCRALMGTAIEAVGRSLGASLGFLGDDVRLIVLPEYFASGFPVHEQPRTWIEKACWKLDGPEYEQLGGIAQRYRVHLAGNVYEVDPRFPELFFQTSFIMDASGSVLLRYRRLHSMYAPTPHDVWDEYLEHHGPDAVFPVVQTELGALAAIASEEILIPELARAFAIRGAEVLVHSTSEMFTGAETPKDIAKRARAVENQLYVVSANSAGVEGIDIPTSSADGGSKIIDPHGRILAQAGSGPSLAAVADIDVPALRRLRARPGMGNLLSRQRYEVARLAYADAQAWPPNTLSDGRTPERGHAREIQAGVLEALGRGDEGQGSDA